MLEESSTGFLRGRNLDLTPTETAALLALGDNHDPKLALKVGASALSNATWTMICYAVQAALSLLIGLGMICFNKYLPTEVGKLHKVFRCFGGLVKIFMNIQIKLHYITMV